VFVAVIVASVPSSVTLVMGDDESQPIKLASFTCTFVRLPLVGQT
jgi:hypothetical protein